MHRTPRRSWSSVNETNEQILNIIIILLLSLLFCYYCFINMKYYYIDVLEMCKSAMGYSCLLMMLSGLPLHYYKYCLLPMWDEGTALLSVKVGDAPRLHMSIRSHPVHHSQLGLSSFTLFINFV